MTTLGSEKVSLLPSTVPDHSLNGVRSILNCFFPLVTRFAQRKKERWDKREIWLQYTEGRICSLQQSQSVPPVAPRDCAMAINNVQNSYTWTYHDAARMLQDMKKRDQKVWSMKFLTVMERLPIELAHRMVNSQDHRVPIMGLWIKINLRIYYIPVVDRNKNAR
jgi:hypothetical protein